MSISTIVTRGFRSSFGNGTWISTRGYGISDVVPVQPLVSKGGYIVHKAKTKPYIKRDTPFRDEVARLYEELPDKVKVEVKSDVVRYAEKRPKSGLPIPTNQIDFDGLINNIAAIESILNAYESMLIERAIDEERSIEMLLLSL